MKRLFFSISALMFLAVLSSCGTDKYLQPGEKVLKKNKIEIIMVDSSVVPKEVYAAMSDAKKYYSQKPNKKMLGIRTKMRIYCSTNPSDSSGWSNWWRKRGEPPVVYNENAAIRTTSQLATMMTNNGCFGTKVTFDTVHTKSNAVEVTYNVAATPRWQIEEVAFRSRQNDVNDLLQETKDKSYLVVGDYYDQDVLIKERNRIVEMLQSKGYYYANNSLVHFIVDTTYENRKLSIVASVRQPRKTAEDGTWVETPLQVYHIGDIYIFPNSASTFENNITDFDTLVMEYKTRRGITDYNFVYNQKIAPSPKVISRSMFIFNRQTYRPSIVSNTTNSLLGLHNFKLIDINFEESPLSTDTNRLLDARIRLLNNNRRKFSVSLELTNASKPLDESKNFLTSGNLGLGTTLNYQNNNLFGGAELLSIDGSLLFEMPKTFFKSEDKSFYNTFASFEGGLSATIDLPNFLIPFSDLIQWQRNKPHTLFGISNDYRFRKFELDETDVSLERIRFSGSFGYSWSHSANAHNKLLPINISYTHTISGSEYFLDLFERTNDIRFIFQTDNYYLVNTHYEYTYSNQAIGVRKNFNYLHILAETSGNLIYGIRSWAKRTPDIYNSEDFSPDRVDYYQYILFDSEFKRYIYWGENSTLVLRALVGLGIPYGHSTSLPYEKMFFGGGPTSMRAWLVRGLGPGTYPTHELDLSLSFGDIQLIFNIEQRFPIIGILEGAVFVDMGNIWSRNDWGLEKGYRFDAKNILKGFAIDAGLGLRINLFSILTLRLDFAVPIHDPGYLEGERWISDHWSWKKIVTNFGINYPF